MAEVLIKNLNKFFKNKHVLKNINLEIRDKEFVVLLGPSGCGKTTLLNIIAGLEPETSGEIFINNEQVNSLSPAERDIGFVFQHYALYPHKTVFENIAFALKFKDIDAPEFNAYRIEGNKINKKELVERRVSEIAKLLHIEDIISAKPFQLSGGQCQRVAIGRALVRKPKLFLFDEPLSNLDALLRVSMREEIKEINRNIENTIIYVTHDQVEAMTLADKIVVINDGRIQQVGSPKEIYESPSNIFVAKFVGSPSMNLIEAEVKTLAPHRAICFTDNTILLPNNDKRSYNHIGQKIILGIRPENIAITEQSSFNQRLPAIVHDYEFLGSNTLVHVDVGYKRLMFFTNGSDNIRRSEKLDIFIDLNKVHIFDPDTGNIIK